MNIDKVNSANMASLYQKNNSERVSANQKIESEYRDIVTISASGNIFKEALKAVQEMPDFRADKVDELASRIKSGSYKPEEYEIANKIIESAIIE